MTIDELTAALYALMERAGPEAHASLYLSTYAGEPHFSGGLWPSGPAACIAAGENGLPTDHLHLSARGASLEEVLASLSAQWDALSRQSEAA